MYTQLTVNSNESPVLDIKDLIVVHRKGSELGQTFKTEVDQLLNFVVVQFQFVKLFQT